MVTMQAGELVAQRRSDILAIAAHYGARNVRVFGSVARGETDEASDIDFLVELQPDRSLFDLGGLVAELTDLLGRPVDVVTVRGLKDRIRERVLAEAVPV
jgi:predicted nucleotidyltransferase